MCDWTCKPRSFDTRLHVTMEAASDLQLRGRQWEIQMWEVGVLWTTVYSLDMRVGMCTDMCADMCADIGVGSLEESAMLLGQVLLFCTPARRVQQPPTSIPHLYT